MGLVIATTGHDFVSGDHVNITSDWEGTAQLRPLYNMVPDPGWRKWNTVDDRLYYWDLGAAPEPTGWMAFVKDNNIQTSFARQTTGPIPLDKDLEIEDELVPGASPLDPSLTVDIAKPIKPKLDDYKVSDNTGYPAGWYCIAYGWKIGGEKGKDLEPESGKGRETGAGPRSDAFELAQGQGFMVTAPTDMPDGAEKIIYYLTKPHDTEQGALTTSSLYVQKEFSTRGQPKVFVFKGPLKTSNKWNRKNTSFLPPEEELDTGVNVRGGRSEFGSYNTAEDEDMELGYRYVTDQGVGPSMGGRRVGRIGKKRKVSFEPNSYPRGAKGWIPEVRTRDKQSGRRRTQRIEKGRRSRRGRRG